MLELREEQRCAIKFQCIRNKSTLEIYLLLRATNCDNATVYRRVEQFQSGRESAKFQGSPCAPHTKLMETIINTAAIYMQENTRLTVRQLASILQTLVRCTHHLLTKELGLSCMRAKWILQLLTNEHKATRMRVCQE